MRKILLLCLPALLLASCIVHEARPPFLARFTNMLYTDIWIQVDGYGSRVISPGETVTFRIERQDQCYSYSAFTHGQDANGEAIGLVVDWSRTNEIYGDSYNTYLITFPDLFFLKMRNTGWRDLRPLHVNIGFPDQTVDDIIIPGNGITYNTGYYRAYAGTRVQANWMDMPSDYTYWQHQVHFNFPWTNNQSVTLLNTFKSDASGKTVGEASSEIGSNALDPRVNEPFGTDAGTPREASGGLLLPAD
ncbi:MAG: hypothetical protein K0B87_00640 [Candidatus Syntrophosphaera sp.]|nr:hypothetical protein [Candidatus Syntrophosphaera sp.]